MIWGWSPGSWRSAESASSPGVGHRFSGSSSLITADRIDREELRARSARCLVNFEVQVEDGVKHYGIKKKKKKHYGIEVEVTAINDSAPQFQAENWK